MYSRALIFSISLIGTSIVSGYSRETNNDQRFNVYRRNWDVRTLGDRQQQRNWQLFGNRTINENDNITRNDWQRTNSNRNVQQRLQSMQNRARDKRCKNNYYYDNDNNVFLE